MMKVIEKSDKMNIEELRKNCLVVKGAEECLPFDDDTLVYKVMGKMFAFFALTPKDNEHFVVMKCNPEKSAELREKYKGIKKGYYTADTLSWNSVYIQKDVPDDMIKELIRHSADEVIKKLPKYKREEYFNQ